MPCQALQASGQHAPVRHAYRPCRFKVEKYMQIVFGLSACLLFVPVLYHQTNVNDVAPTEK